MTTQGGEGSGIVQERERKGIVRRRETVQEKGGERGIIQETMVPREERKSGRGKEMTVGKEKMAESTDPITGRGAAASLPRGAVPEAAVLGGDTVATTGDNTAFSYTLQVVG